MKKGHSILPVCGDIIEKTFSINNMEIILIIDYFGLSLQRNNLNNETCKDFSTVYLDLCREAASGIISESA